IDYSNFSFSDISLLPLLGLFITLASAYRLAKFNLDEDQQTYFKGLPTPANALLIIALPLIMEFQGNDYMNAIILNKWFLIIVTLLSCYTLNSGIKLFAFKFINCKVTTIASRYIFIIVSALVCMALQFAAILLFISASIVMSSLDSVTSRLFFRPINLIILNKIIWHQDFLHY